MSEAASESRTNATEYTVSEISGALKRTVEDVFGNVRVRGEISGYRGPHSSGHAYFALKDDRARLDAVVWKGTMSRLKFRPEEGMEVIATGKLTTYPGKSNYQIVIDNLEPAGAGALMALLEERKRRLQAEGLFDAARKRRLPFMPLIIGVVTSPTGSVIRDIIHRIKDRFPLHVLVWPVRVQGETSGVEVTNAVAGFNALAWDSPIQRPDLLIVARGGGSLEDLWGFNDEALARAVAASGIPVISAVGHETDWTLIDLVADVRAPTPTGAAEIAVPVKADLEATLASLGARLKAAVSRNFERKRQAARAAARALPSPDQLLALPRRRLDEATSRLGRGLSVSVDRKRARLQGQRLTPATLSRRINEARTLTGRDLARAQAAFFAIVRERRARFARTATRLSPAPIARRQKQQTDALAALARRQDRVISLRLERLRGQLSQAERLLTTLSHKAVLARGFALVKDADGAVIKQAADVTSGMALSLEFADGTADAVATSGAARPKPAAKPAAKAKEPGNQGSLF
ncbi:MULTISPECIES: exodeoxyribonuclease VII large subunit [Mesorhizobium]|uniref:Exodeoxyribonuclease 7 large subunit n=1 Tax=Rhizobium loti TaxID=381 RepID=A0A6M7TYT7_RHILI|nr:MULTISPECIES: exodeoxyribonuclease VII large subunit [Mesorhizobium]KRB32612.1 exodeoxyribonuclease VII large subunit [Mesorhizobium sp. Root172]OBQ57753.1 exodeoxyribonuclease VII large subunit [Mesorhizobium loti]QKC70164.1 exodeoxyribonuclease VII large subunit [Mesorhizobium loti]